MKFPTDRPVKVVMLGAGGTGGYVAPYVFRLLHMLDRPARFVVCDGDIVEPKNLDRQNFVPADLGENKARVLAERYSTVLGMETEYVPSFIEKLPDLMELIEPKEWELSPYSTKRTKEMVLLLGCVDNNKTRQLCHQAFHQSEELIYIDSGNGKYTGQVVCGVRRNGRTIRKSIGGVHPEMLKDTDLFPSEISCAEAAQEDPQSRDYRTGIAGTRDLIKCAGYAQQCINGEKKLNIPKADGYLQVALCLNARMEDMLNVTDTKMNGTLPFSSQLADAVREAVRDYHEGSMYKRDEAVRTFRRNLFPRWKPGLGNVLACCDIFQIILEAAYEKYVSAANQNNQNYQEIARLGYVSKAYLVLAAIGTSGGALNLLAQMLINQANQYEADQRISFFRRHPDIDTFVQQHAAPYGWPLNDNYALAYRVLQSVCGIQRGSQPYSHMKKAELVLKGYVSESSSTQLTSLNIAINGGLAMGHYWKGRLLLEQAKQDHDRCNDYKDAAIASFCATNVTERFDHLPENADEDAAPQLSPPQWLSAIELLRYPDRAVFRVDRRMVFQTIYQKLTQQVEEVQSDNIQIHNERYRLTKKDVRSNLERCLDMVKAQFPDKEPLIQKMIRSIR